MLSLTGALQLFSVFCIGIVAGGLALDGAVIVPYLRQSGPAQAVQAAQFFAPRAVRFFATLIVIGTIAAIFAMIGYRDLGSTAAWFWLLGTLLSIAGIV